VVLALLAPASALAHGRPPALQSLDAHPDAPETLVAQATWGLAVRGGGDWRWLCAAAFGVDARSEDPAVIAGPDGALLVGTFDGLWRSPDGGCSWERPEARLADAFVVDVQRGPGDLYYAVASDVAREDRLWRSRDGGRQWEVLSGFGEVLVDRVRVAPSRPDRLYASGAIPARDGRERETFLLRSDDGGRSFERFPVPFEPEERLLLLEAVDPVDPDALWAVMLHFAGELAPERLLRSEDGGETWTSPLALPQIGGVVATEGAVLAGSRLGGLYRSEDGGTFEALDPALPVTCLAALGGELWACTDRAVAGFGLARVVDGAVEPALALSEIVDPVACPRCSTAGVVCPAWAPDVAYDLGQDASVPPGFGDGGTGAPRDAEIPAECRPPGPPGCACGVGAGETPSWPLGLIFVAWILRRVTQK